MTNHERNLRANVRAAYLTADRDEMEVEARTRRERGDLVGADELEKMVALCNEQGVLNYGETV